MSNPENTLQHSKSITQMLEDQLKKDFEADFRAGSDNTQQWLNVKLRLVGTQYASDEVYFAYRFYKAAHARYSPQMAAPQGFNVLAHNRTTGEWLYKNHADQWQNCPAPFHTPQPVVPESDILPLVWMRPEDAARTMIAAEGERAEVAPDKEGDFDVPLYRHPQPAQVNQQLLELQEDLDETLRLLADWAVAVRDNGSGWDYWDDYYKETMYGNLRVREKLDVFISETFERERSSDAIAAAQEQK